MEYKSKFKAAEIDARLGAILDSSYMDKIYEQTLTIEEVSYLHEQSIMHSLFLFDGTEVWQLIGDSPKVPDGFALTGRLRLNNNRLAQSVILVDIIDNEVKYFEEEYRYDLADLQLM